tara:strand:- start:460 stop:822 length:363 start_codon:yes stop_codon:yes gene_type:complete
MKTAQSEYLTGRLEKIIKDKYDLEVSVTYSKETSEMAYTTLVMEWLTFSRKEADYPWKEKKLYLHGSIARWEKENRGFKFSTDEKVLKHIAMRVVAHFDLAEYAQNKGWEKRKEIKNGRT